MTAPNLPPPPAPAATGRAGRPRRRWLAGLLVVGTLGVLAIGAVVGLAGIARDVESRGTSIEPVSAIRFRGDAAGFELVEADRDDVRVDIETTSSPWQEPVVETDVVEGVLVVTSRCSGALRFSCSIETVVEVPYDSLAELDVEVAAGAVRVAGTAARVVASTQSGRVELAEHRGTSARVATQAGRVRVDARVVPQDLDVHVATGDIDIRLPDATYDVDASTSVGSVSTSVRETDDATNRVVARADVGDIDIVMD